jgi:hypothetical protein
MMRSLPIQIENFNEKVVGWIVLEFTYIKLNAKKKLYKKI